VNAAQPLSGQRALVTGASGFIGSRLCTRLVQAGADVFAVSRSERADDDLRWTTTDLADNEAVQLLVREVKPDLIFHLASHVSGSRELDAILPTLRDNLVSTVNVLLAAAQTGCKRIVLAGSLEEPDIADDGHPVPVSPYAAAKFAATAYAGMFHRLHGVPVVVLRIFMVYGPGQRDETKLVPYVITSLLRGEPPSLSSATRPVDWVYVDDVVEGFARSATREGLIGEVVDVGSGILTPVRTVVEEIALLLRPSVEPRFGALRDRPNERIRVADVNRTRSLLGWVPPTQLGQGLAATVDWYAREAATRGSS
jgi:UDP-glucose 4-epimerase